jgi:hypothetical protein
MSRQRIRCREPAFGPQQAVAPRWRERRGEAGEQCPAVAARGPHHPGDAGIERDEGRREVFDAVLAFAAGQREPERRRVGGLDVETDRRRRPGAPAPGPRRPGC